MGVTIPDRRSNVSVVRLVLTKMLVSGLVHQATIATSGDDAVEESFLDPINGVQTLG